MAAVCPYPHNRNYALGPTSQTKVCTDSDVTSEKDLIGMTHLFFQCLVQFSRTGGSAVVCWSKGNEKEKKDKHNVGVDVASSLCHHSSIITP